MDDTTGAAEWISLSSDIRRAIARMPTSPATAITRFCEENGVDPARAARVVRAREHIDRLCRRYRVDMTEIAIAAMQVQGLVLAEAEDPIGAAKSMGGWLRGIAPPPPRETRPKALGRALDLRSIALSCLEGDPNSRADVEIPYDLGPEGQFCRIDQEMVVANAQPDDHGRIRARIRHALVVSPRLAPSRDPGRPVAQAMLGLCASLAFYDKAHYYACDEAEAEAMGRIRSASRIAGRLTIVVHQEVQRSTAPRADAPRGARSTTEREAFDMEVGA